MAAEAQARRAVKDLHRAARRALGPRPGTRALAVQPSDFVHVIEHDALLVERFIRHPAAGARSRAAG